MMALVWLALGLVTVVAAAPRQVERRATTTLTQANIDAFTPFTHIAAVSYCPLTQTKTWACGSHCEATPEFVPTAVGGNGGNTPFWLVGYYPPLNSVFASFQGTNFSNLMSVLVDIDFLPDSLDSQFFPGISSSVKTHGGFGDAQQRSANDVLAAVQTTLASHPDATVVTTGHSMGAAVAQISAVHLRLHLPATTKVKYVGISAPRVGNPAWAALVDSLVGDIAHINNKKDPIPTLPPRVLGFEHPAGELHITLDNVWLSCSGHESSEKNCTLDTVPNFLSGDANDHVGPFNGILLGENTCAT
ncbi:alpha/beta-hydrolase [Auriculariales sp. MPI-PUGE-AT-0066]|nr:alpha/beta-hydrolase [Auriculariales sp. MPI-PUGE-AT-0066]